MLIQSTVRLDFEAADDLQYRGEGNSALVVSLGRDVLRFFKHAPREDKQSCEESFQRIQRHIHFVETVVRHVISPDFYSTPRVALLSRKQMKTIAKLIGDKRPSFRLSKGIQCADSACAQTAALLLPDYCCLPQHLRDFRTEGPIVCIEVKPKRGFLPKEALLSHEFKVKSRVSRYCLSQFLKLQKGSIQRRSAYCPLDLFSGCPQRTQTALRALIRDPQNNFRVFRDSHHVFGDSAAADSSALSPLLRDFCGQSEDDVEGALCRLVAKALALRVDTSRPEDEALMAEEECDLHHNSNHCFCTSEHALTSGSVLDCVLRAQRLDAIDSEVALQLLQRVNSNDVWTPPTLDAADQSEDLALKVFRFLVSLTAKDLSIMITMQRLEAEADVTSLPSRHLIGDSERNYLAAIRIIDLDQKSDQKIKRTFSKDMRMIAAFNTSAKNNNNNNSV